MSAVLRSASSSLVWTEAQKNQLRQFCNQGQSWTVISRLLDFPKNICKTQAQQLGYVAAKTNTVWTDTESERLKTFCASHKDPTGRIPIIHWQDIAEKLGRTIKACQQHASQKFYLKSKRLSWKDKESTLLTQLCNEALTLNTTISNHKWEEISSKLPGRSVAACQKQAKNLSLLNRDHHYPWLEDEETLFRQLCEETVQEHGTISAENWKEISSRLPGRTVTACKTHAQRLNLTHGHVSPWTEQESSQLTQLCKDALADRDTISPQQWEHISAQLPGRSVEICKTEARFLGYLNGITGNDWTTNEKNKLQQLCTEAPKVNSRIIKAEWEKIALKLPGRTVRACQNQACTLGCLVNTNFWKDDETRLLKQLCAQACAVNSFISQNQWEEISAQLPGRTALGCRKKAVGLKYYVS